jgi:hypothetical protein
VEMAIDLFKNIKAVYSYIVGEKTQIFLYLKKQEEEIRIGHNKTSLFNVVCKYVLNPYPSC